MREMTFRISEDLKRLAHESHDNCVSCGCSFEKYDTSHLGYNEKGEPLYVCDNCSIKLVETAIRYSFSPRPYEIPTESTKLWRYMDFAKYVSLLSTSSLFFARADTFDDIFEGARGLKKNKKQWDEHLLLFFKEAIRNPPEGYKCEKSDEEIEKEANRLLSEFELGGDSRKKTYINCWHENEHESEAMWRLYSSYIDNAIAIKSSYKRLCLALGRNPDINIGRVKYIDLQKGFTGDAPFWRKRKSFKHENEVRAIIYDSTTTGVGKLMQCDLTVLIKEVFISPSAPSWFRDLINDVNCKYGLNIKVSSSELSEEPFF